VPSPAVSGAREIPPVRAPAALNRKPIHHPEKCSTIRKKIKSKSKIMIKRRIRGKTSLS
jgi:hypothetical protein